MDPDQNQENRTSFQQDNYPPHINHKYAGEELPYYKRFQCNLAEPSTNSENLCESSELGSNFERHKPRALTMSSFKFMANLETRDCLRCAATSIISDSKLQEFFRQGVGTADILERVTCLLEAKIPIQYFIDQAKEQCAVSGILSDLVQTGLRKEILCLKESLSSARKDLAKAVEGHATRSKEMEELAKATDLRAESVAKREIECSQRELACELLLENETRRIQELQADLHVKYEENCQEHRRQLQFKENKIRELNSRLVIALAEKTTVEERLLRRNEKSSDERLIEAFQKLKDIIQSDQEKKKKMENLIVSQERRYLDMLEQEKELKCIINSMRENCEQQGPFQSDAIRLQRENECLREEIGILNRELQSFKAETHQVRNLKEVGTCKSTVPCRQSLVDHSAFKSFFRAEGSVREIADGLNLCVQDISSLRGEFEAGAKNYFKAQEDTRSHPEVIIFGNFESISQLLDLARALNQELTDLRSQLSASQEENRIHDLKASEAEAHVLVLQDQIQQQEIRLEILKSQTRDILKISSMQIELRNWEVFAYDLLQSDGRLYGCVSQSKTTRNGNFSDESYAVAEEKKEDMRRTVVNIPTNELLQSNDLEPCVVSNEKRRHRYSTLISVEDINMQAPSSGVVPSRLPSRLDEGLRGPEYGFARANSGAHFHTRSTLDDPNDNAERVDSQDRTFLSGCTSCVNDFVGLQSEIKKLQLNFENER